MKRIAVYPGSFDPVTNGHIDIMRRGSRLFDQLIVGVTANSLKNPYFSLAERVAFLEEAVKGIPRIQIASFKGLLVDFVKQRKAYAIIRGLRAVSDFEYEFQMALMNRRQFADFETVFLMPDERYTYLSSSIVREVSRSGGNVGGLVPKPVELALKRRARQA